MAKAAVLISMAILMTSVNVLHIHSADSGQQADYHLRMLRRHVDRIKKSWSPPSPSTASHVFKRSTRLKADDLILNSLSSYCLAFKTDPEITKHLQENADREPLRSRDLSGHTKYHRPNQKSNTDKTRNNDPEHNTFPVQILAERKDEKVWYIFHIAHSSSVTVSRLDAFQFQKTNVKFPEDACGEIVSKVRFSVDSPNRVCRRGKSNVNNVEAIFKLTEEDGSREAITIFVDVCKFDKEWDNIGGGMRKKPGIISKSVGSIPKLSILQSTDTRNASLRSNEIDQTIYNLTFDMEVPISSTNRFTVRLDLWDKSFAAIDHSSAEIRYDKHKRGNIHIKYDREQRTKLFTVQLVGKPDDKKGNLSKLRLIIHEAERQNKDGLLSVSYLWSVDTTKQYSSSVVKKIRVDRNIPINMVGDSQVFPDGLVYFNANHRYLCSERGIIYPRTGLTDKNCTLRCEAFGRDIHSIYMTTLQPSKRAVRSASIVFHDNALGVLDVGPASGDVEGDYQCTVVDGRGESKHRPLKLYTSRFTKIETFELVYVDAEIADVRCVVAGDGNSMDISIAVMEGRNNLTPLDADGEFIRRNATHEQSRDLTTLELRVSWEKLRAPRDRLVCLARGERGDDEQLIYLIQYSQNFIGIHPRINRTEFEVFRFPNGTYFISCSATGVQPMTVEIFLSQSSVPISEFYRVDVTSRSDDGKTTVMYYVRDYSFGYRASFYCRAKNELGSDSEFFYIGP